MSDLCCVAGCRSGREETTKAVTFHRFPQNEKKAEWIAALGEENLIPTKSDLICSRHFVETDFILSELGEALELIPEAVPSIRMQESDEAMVVEEISSDNAALMDTVLSDPLIGATDVSDTSMSASISTKANELDNEGSEEFPKNSDETEDRDKNNEVKYSHLAKLIQVDREAPREKLLEQFNRAFTERQVLRKRMKVLKRKNLRTIERIAKACEKKDKPPLSDTVVNEPEIKKRKKPEPHSKICPQNLDEVVTYLETQDLISKKAISVIRAIHRHSLTEHIEQASQIKDQEMEVSSALKTFAKTLLFYSAEAYHMVKEIYELPIPPASVARTWYNMGLGLPGWSSEAFLTLKDEIQKFENSILQTCVIIGEFDVSTASSFDDQEVRGHIDYGTTGDLQVQSHAENLPLAQSALFFMLVPMNSKKKWKIPLAFFLIETLSPEERANVIMECLWRVYNMGSVVVSIVLDASSISRQTVESLGIAFEDLPYPCTSFPHPADGLLDVHIFFDSSDILELMRHTWASVSLMVDEKGGAISWKYFTELMKIQETQAGSSDHIDQVATWYWDKSLIRKRLIGQLFTTNVADAIECCSQSLMLSQFAGSESTVTFIKTMNKILEIFTSDQSSLKQAKNIEWKKNIVEALNYLFVLRDRTGQGIFATTCKAPFVCLYMNLISVLELCKKISPLSISHLSLDALDLMYIGIRAKCNWEDCPTATKLVNAYSLLLQEEGCAFTEDTVKVDGYGWIDKYDVSNARKSGLKILRPALKPENTPPLPQVLTFYPVLLQNELQRFRASQLILVHVVKRVADVLHCSVCIEGLQMTYEQDNPTLTLLRKTCGGFVYPSQGVVQVCKLADHHLRTLLKISSFELKHDVYTRRDTVLIQSVCISVMNSILNQHRKLFPQLDNHQRKCLKGSDHVNRLIRVLTASFVLLRLQSLRAWASSQF